MTLALVDSERPWWPIYDFTVEGTPAPQGSKQGFVRGGKVSLVEVSKRVKPWRAAVEAAAIIAADGAPALDAPLLLEVTFYMQAPQKQVRPYPSVRPDLSKLVRSTEDALVTAGMLADDSRIIITLSDKEYGPIPGARIRIYALEPRDESA